ncbi:hypothetical protein [Mycobacterium asiaticum]|uniref:hypothetical protein n=1 Tax=Mycobacterium asiaticum TaxID=1790 RepID=UPI000ACD9A80|nr:hypothetical protein [Mycobacterium asiaticum]
MSPLTRDWPSGGGAAAAVDVLDVADGAGGPALFDEPQAATDSAVIAASVKTANRAGWRQGRRVREDIKAAPIVGLSQQAGLPAAALY